MKNLKTTLQALTVILFYLLAGNSLSAKENVTKVMWQKLRELDLNTGKMPGDLKKLSSGGFVKIPGYMVPLEDNDSEVTEFLLVPYPQACVHTPAPPANQIVHVKMKKGKKAAVTYYEPIWIYGNLKVGLVESMYATAIYSLSGLKIEPYQRKE